MRTQAHAHTRTREAKHMTATELIGFIFLALALAGFLTAAQEIGKAILLDDEGKPVSDDKADDGQIHFTKSDKKTCQQEVAHSKTEEPAC